MAHALRRSRARLYFFRRLLTNIVRRNHEGNAVDRLSDEIIADFSDRIFETASAARQRLQPGIGIYGLLTAEIGVGQGGRRIARALQAAQVPLSLHNIALPHLFESRVDFPASDELASSFNTALIHLNPDTLLDVIRSFAPEVLLGRHRIGYWLWELPVFPARWAPAFDHVHEVWVPSRFVARAVATATTMPVRIVPYPVPVIDMPQREARTVLQLPADRFLFLTIFDLNSHLARKNPFASIRAFLDAFPRGGAFRDVAMVVKCHGRNRGADFDDLARVIASDDRLILIDRVLSPDDMTRLQAACDLYVSLHRSEGFGFNIAECMALGKACIVTDFSSNTDFNTADNSLPIPCTMKAVAAGEYPHGAGQYWAEPSHDAAVAAMRLAASTTSKVEQLGRQARADIGRLYSLERTAEIARSAWRGELPAFSE
jgi:glycosyltransferase involved in cell wall biosynthesis